MRPEFEWFCARRPASKRIDDGGRLLTINLAPPGLQICVSHAFKFRMIDRGDKFIQRRTDDHRDIGRDLRRMWIERMVGQRLAIHYRRKTQQIRDAAKIRYSAGRPGPSFPQHFVRRREYLLIWQRLDLPDRACREP